MANNQLKEELILSTQHFDKKIDDVIKRVNTLKKQGDKVGDGFNGSMGKMIEKATGFNGSMGSLVGVVGKFSGALGIVTTATEAFNKTIHSSQTLEDQFGTIQLQLNTTIDNFFQSLASGDFSPFLNGIENITSKAREAFEAMDNLWNMAQSFSVQNARLGNQFEKNLIEIRSKKGSKNPNDIKRVKELKEENKRIIEQQAKGGLKLYNQTISGLQSEIAAGTGMNSKITEGAIYRIVENDINNLKEGRKKYQKEYSEYLKEVGELQKKYAAKSNGGGLISTLAEKINPSANYGAKYQKELNNLQTKYGESIAANYLLQRKSDKELEEFNNKLKQGLTYQGAALSNQSKMLRYTKETTEATGGKGNKGGGKGGNTKTGIEYAVNSVGYLENKIRELQQEIRLQVDPTEIRKIQQEITKTKSQLSELMQPTKKLTEKEITDTFQGAKITNVVTDSLADLQEFLDREPLQISFESDKKKVLAETVDLLDSMAGSFSSLGDSLELPELNVAGTIAQAIASIISGYAQATAQAADLGPWAWVGFAVAGLAELASVISSIHNLSGYANGGVIGGSSYSGDNLLARVNSGEMILNSREQSNLFHLLDSGSTGGVNGGNVHFVIRGSELHGVLANYNSRNSKLK